MPTKLSKGFYMQLDGLSNAITQVKKKCYNNLWLEHENQQAKADSNNLLNRNTKDMEYTSITQNQ